MADIVPPERRSAMMAGIRQRDTGPELLVRRALHAAGLRFRLQRTDLPGRPDVVLPASRIAIFVHGCFWHRHPGCRKATTPSSRVDFWSQKFSANVDRDARVERDLMRAGWLVRVVWECDARKPVRLAEITREIAALALSRRPAPGGRPTPG